jgi:hypothetical protein
MAQHMPVVRQDPSELGPLLKTRYPNRTDTYSMKFGKGHRTYLMVTGRRPITRTAKRALRPL